MSSTSYFYQLQKLFFYTTFVIIDLSWHPHIEQYANDLHCKHKKNGWCQIPLFISGFTILYYATAVWSLLYLMQFMQQNFKKNNFWVTVTKHFSVLLERVDKNLATRKYNIFVSPTIDSNDFCDHVTCHAAPPAVQRETSRQLWDYVDVQTFITSLSTRVWTEVL